ncbi:hypothetical protein LINPERPRIM_LOCUS5274 [Linum perenne]
MATAADSASRKARFSIGAVITSSTSSPRLSTTTTNGLPFLPTLGFIYDKFLREVATGTLPGIKWRKKLQHLDVSAFFSRTTNKPLPHRQPHGLIFLPNLSPLSFFF